MRISKLLSAVCAAAFLAGSLAVRAQDNPAQAAARAALKDKMSESDAQQNQPAPPVIVATPSGAVPEQAGQPTNAAPKVEPTPKTTDDNAVMTPVNKPVSKEDKAIAKAEKAAAAADLKAKKEADRKATRQKTADEAAAKAQVKAKAKADAQQAAAAKAQAGTPGVAPAVKPPSPANASYAGKTLGFKPIEAPPPPVSAQKQVELQALLARYMANQISPDEYFKERAAILAAP
jgi:Ni/Co efflux regulator RcnB